MKREQLMNEHMPTRGKESVDRLFGRQGFDAHIEAVLSIHLPDSTRGPENFTHGVYPGSILGPEANEGFLRVRQLRKTKCWFAQFLGQLVTPDFLHDLQTFTFAETTEFKSIIFSFNCCVHVRSSFVNFRR